MRTVERLIATSLVEMRLVDPEEPDAQRCLRAYVAELNRRAPDRGFDPSKGSTAKPHEVAGRKVRSSSCTYAVSRSGAAP